MPGEEARVPAALRGRHAGGALRRVPVLLEVEHFADLKSLFVNATGSFWLKKYRHSHRAISNKGTSAIPKRNKEFVQVKD